MVLPGDVLEFPEACSITGATELRISALRDGIDVLVGLAGKSHIYSTIGWSNRSMPGPHGHPFGPVSLDSYAAFSRNTSITDGTVVHFLYALALSSAAVIDAARRNPDIAELLKTKVAVYKGLEVLFPRGPGFVNFKPVDYQVAFDGFEFEVFASQEGSQRFAASGTLAIIPEDAFLRMVEREVRKRSK